MQNGFKFYLVSGVTVVVVLGGFAWLHANLVDTMDRLDQAEMRLQQAEKAAKSSAGNGGTEKPAPATDASYASAQELDALRNELNDLRKQLANASTGKSAIAAVDGSGTAGGTAPEAVGSFSPESVAAIKKVIAETLEEREKDRRTQWATMGEDWMKQRTQQSLDELEERLKLTAYQKDQLGKVLDEQRKAAAELMATMWSGGGPPMGGNREDMRKKFTDLSTATDTKVKQFLTASQSTDYDKWKEETGGFAGGMRGMGGGGPVGGRGGRGDGQRTGGKSLEIGEGAK